MKKTEAPKTDKEMNDLMSQLKTAGRISGKSMDDDDIMLNNFDIIPIDIPVLNLALSGSLNGGLRSGVTIFQGPSRTFKTNLGLKMVESYLKKYPNAICLFYDSEFGTTKAYFEELNIAPDRIIHLPAEDIEQVRDDLVQRLELIQRGHKVIIFIDSIGNLPSKREVDNAMNSNAAADMATRAKSLKSMFRTITGKIVVRDLPCVVINHTYTTLELYSKQVGSGGSGPLYNANDIFTITRAQEKDKDNKLEGYTFTLNAEKSRTIREKSQLPLTVTFDEVIDRHSGLLDLGLETGFIVQPTKQTYQLASDTKSPPVKKVNVGPLLDILLTDPEFDKALSKKYKL